jgi:hypothetical protein
MPGDAPAVPRMPQLSSPRPDMCIKLRVRLNSHKTHAQAGCWVQTVHNSSTPMQLQDAAAAVQHTACDNTTAELHFATHTCNSTHRSNPPPPLYLCVELHVGRAQSDEPREQRLVQVAVLLEGHVLHHRRQLVVVPCRGGSSRQRKKGKMRAGCCEDGEAYNRRP